MAGGVPVLPALRTGLCGDRLHGIAGILNGTCNYILSRIENGSHSLQRGARRSTGARLCRSGRQRRSRRRRCPRQALHPRPGRIAGPRFAEEIRARTIRTIEAVDFDYCGGVGLHHPANFSRGFERHHFIRRRRAQPGPHLFALRARAEKSESGFDIWGIWRRRRLSRRGRGRRSHSRRGGFRFDVRSGKSFRRARSHRALKIASPKVSCDFETPWYLRFVVKDQPGIIASLAAILSAHQLNIDAVLQKPGFDKNALPFVITLEPCRDTQLHPAFHEMSAT